MAVPILKEETKPLEFPNELKKQNKNKTFKFKVYNVLKTIRIISPACYSRTLEPRD